MSQTTARQSEPASARQQQPVTALTGPAAAIFTELHGLDGGATVAALALAAGVSRSTASKALVTLESTGLATRTPGGNDNTRRLPDLWHPNRPAAAETPDNTVAAEAREIRASAEPDAVPPVSGINATELTNANESQRGVAAEQPGTDKAIDSDLQGDDGPPATVADPAGPDAEPDTGTGHGGDTAPTRAPGAPDAPVPAAGGLAVPPGQACPTCGHRRRAAAPKGAAGGGSRLGSGQLHQMVLDHLREHPDEDWTATGIANVVGRSSGAIANALATMVSRGEAEQTCDKPRRYRASVSTTAA